MPKNVILIENQAGDLEAWGSLTAFCETQKENFYPKIRRLKFPFTYNGLVFRKLKYNQKINKK